MADGLHFVRIGRIWYVYAWRGGPRIMRAEGARPKRTAELMDRAAEARREHHRAVGGDTIAGLIMAYKSPETAEWSRLSASTKATWTTWLDRIREKFGSAPLAVFNNPQDRRIRGDVLDWRDNWSDQPRSADMLIQVFSRLLSWGADRGRLSFNVLAGVGQLYESDRSGIIWEAAHFDAFNAAASIEVQEGVELAACTGLRRGDLVQVPWAAVGEHAIVWQTSKSRGRARIVIPILPETKALLDRIKARHADCMAAQRPSRRKDPPETILSNSYWRPWTPGGFGSRFNDAKVESGIMVNLHDLRGTFATRCMIAGLTDQEIADILGWTTKEVSTIRVKYVDQARVVVAIGERIAASSVKRL